MRCVPWARSCGQIRNRKNVKKTFSVCGARRRFFLIEVKNRQIKHAWRSALPRERGWRIPESVVNRLQFTHTNIGYSGRYVQSGGELVVPKKRIPEMSKGQSDPEYIISEVERAFGQSADLQVHRFQAGAGELSCVLLYLKSFIDVERLSQSVLVSLLSLQTPPVSMAKLAEAIPCVGTKELSSLPEFCQAVAWGEAVLLVSGFQSGLSIPLQKYEKRVVTESENEKIIRGPRDSFVESLWSNIGLLRTRLKNPDLRLEVLTLGARTSAEVGLVYLESLANPLIVDEVRSRIQRVNVDRLLATDNLSEFITDAPWSPFPLGLRTERPDRLASALVDGRVGILLEGNPVVLVVPVVFWDFFKSPDDYIENQYVATSVRLLRLGAFFVTLFLSGFYVATTTIHLEMIPQPLALIIAGARTRTPFPTALEMIAMEIVIEILREGVIRMPGVLGQTISIVGALVIGESAVTAGLIEPIILVVVAFNALAAFVAPVYHAAVSVRILRFPIILLSASLGFFGLMLGALFYLMHLVSLRSVGVPYLAPVGPLSVKEMGDLFIRLPLWQQNSRPSYLRPQDATTQAPGQKPAPDTERGTQAEKAPAPDKAVAEKNHSPVPNKEN